MNAPQKQNSKRLEKAYSRLEERWVGFNLERAYLLSQSDREVLDLGLRHRANQSAPGYKKYGVMHRQTTLFSYSPHTYSEWYEGKLVFDHVVGSVFALITASRSVGWSGQRIYLASVNNFGQDLARAVALMDRQVERLDMNATLLGIKRYASSRQDQSIFGAHQRFNVEANPFSAHRGAVLTRLKEGVAEKADQDKWLREHADAQVAARRLVELGFTVE